MKKKLLQIILALLLGGSALKAQCLNGSAGPDQTICAGTTALPATVILSATTPSGYTGIWTKVGTSPPGTITTPANASSTVTGITAAGTLTLIWTVTDGANCVGLQDTVSIIIQARPTANAGTDRTICLNGTATLNASTPPAGSIGTWSKLGGANSATTVITDVTNRQSTVTGFAASTSTGQKDTLRWTVTNSLCGITVTDDVVIIVNPAPAPVPNAGLDQQKCQGDTITLIGNTPTLGTPSFVLPTNSILSFIGSGNNDTVRVRAATAGGQTSVVYRIANGSTSGNNPAATVLNGCILTDTVVVTFNPSTANAGVDQGICQTGLTTVTLAATPVAPGETGTWSFIKKKGSEVITSPNSPTSTVTAITSDTLILRWTITGGGCTDYDETAVLLSAAPTVANAGPDRSGCDGDTLLIVGSNPTIGSPIWTLAPGVSTTNIAFVPGNAASTSNDTVRVRLRNPGVYTIYYTISVGAPNTTSPCTSRDSVTITIHALPNADAGNDQAHCTGSTFTVRGNKPPVGGTGVWSIVAPGAGTVTTTLDSVGTVTGLAQGTTTLRWTLFTSNGCKDDNNMTITLNPTPPTVANAGADITGCMGDTIRVIGNTPVTGTSSWTRATGTASANIGFVPSANNDTTYLRLITAGSYKVYYNISVGNVIAGSTCTSRDSINITVLALPTASAGTDQASCDGTTTTFTVRGNKPAVGTGVWSIVPPGVGTVNTADTVGTVTGLANGITTLAWKVSNGICSATDFMTIAIGPAIVANAGADKTGCVNDTLKLFGSTATVGLPTWTLASGVTATNIAYVPGNAASTNNDTALVRLRVAGTYNLVYSIALGACPVTRDTVSITINAVPTVNAGLDQSSCDGAITTFTVNGNKSAVGTGIWSIVPPGAGAVNTTDTVGIVTGLAKGITTLTWKIINTTTTCSARDNMTITLGPTLVANAGPDKTGCIGDTLPVYGNVATLGTPVWSRATGTNTNYSFVPTANNDTVNVRLRTAGTYNLVYSITLGTCPASRDTMVFAINAAPTVAAAGADITAACGDTVTLIGNTAISGTPNWSTLNTGLATILGNANNSTVNVTLTAPGTATMKYSISNGTTKACASSDSLTITITPCAIGIFDKDVKISNLLLHPNPANGVFYLSLKGINAGSAEITILTLDGRAVHTEQLSFVKEISKKIDISGFARGSYFIKVKMNGGTEFKKIVIQ